MSLPKLEQYLRENKVPFLTTSHAPAFTAQEIAANAHIRGKQMVKTVMVKLDEQLAMVVLPASERVHMGLLCQVTGAQQAMLASESEFKERFSECEVGAMPPFGNLYGMLVIASDTLAEDETIAFNAGNHTDLISMAYRDFERIAHPQVAHLGRH